MKKFPYHIAWRGEISPHILSDDHSLYSSDGADETGGENNQLIFRNLDDAKNKFLTKIKKLFLKIRSFYLKMVP